MISVLFVLCSCCIVLMICVRLCGCSLMFGLLSMNRVFVSDVLSVVVRLICCILLFDSVWFCWLSVRQLSLMLYRYFRCVCILVSNSFNVLLSSVFGRMMLLKKCWMCLIGSSIRLWMVRLGSVLSCVWFQLMLCGMKWLVGVSMVFVFFFELSCYCSDFVFRCVLLYMLYGV